MLPSEQNVVESTPFYIAPGENHFTMKLPQVKKGRAYLRYNGNPAYKEAVIAKGAALIGPNFKPLLDFMPLADYNRLQASTSHAFFGNLRQEAVGNILIVLYLGAKVFLFRSNPVYEWMQSKGLKAFAIEELTQEELDTPLDPDTQRRNREILTSLYNRRRLGELIAGLK